MDRNKTSSVRVCSPPKMTISLQPNNKVYYFLYEMSLIIISQD